MRPENLTCLIGAIPDMTVLYFPFLIAAVLLTVMVLFGKLKKKATLKDGKLLL